MDSYLCVLFLSKGYLFIIEDAFDSHTSALEDVGIDHGCLYDLMSMQLLNGNVALDPIFVRFLGTRGIMFDVDAVADLIEEFFPRRGGCGRRRRLHSWPSLSSCHNFIIEIFSPAV